MSKKKVQMAEIYPLISEMLDTNGKVTFTVTGVSMQPMIYNKRDSVTLVKPKLPLKKYDIPLYKMDDGRFIMHRIIKLLPDGSYTCRGDNCWEPETPIRNDQIIGVVKSFTRNGREIVIGRSLGYYLYTRTWPFFHHFKRFYKYFFKAKKSVNNIVENIKNRINPLQKQVTGRDGVMKTITYRKASRSDLAVIQQLSFQHMEYEINSLNNDVASLSWVYSENGKKWFLDYIENHFLWLAFCDKKAVGYISGRVFDRDSDNFPVGYCKGVFVDNAYRGLGIASELLNQLKIYCKEKKCCKLKVDYLSGNTSAEKLYQHNGFEPYSQTVICSLD